MGRKKMNKVYRTQLWIPMEETLNCLKRCDEIYFMFCVDNGSRKKDGKVVRSSFYIDL